MADPDYWITSLHCQYRNGFVTSVMCIKNKASIMPLFSLHIIDLKDS